MAVKIFITIDTEEDDWGDYRPRGQALENLTRIRLVQDIFDRYGAIPTYLVTYPVTQNESVKSILLDILESGKAEIGAHCHPWNTPPFEEETNEENSMLCNLPYDLIGRKLEILHHAITKNFKVKPLCFRAGRWGFSPAVAQSICALGYKVDTSVTPFIDWIVYRGPDFCKAPSFSYRFDPSDVLRQKPDGPLLEVPPTIGFLQKHFRLCNSIKEVIAGGCLSRYHILGFLDRIGVLNFRWLSPEVSNGVEMIQLSKSFTQRGCDYLNMSFHSTSLLPGRSPFVRNDQELGNFLNNVEMFLQFAVARGMSFRPLSAALEEGAQKA